MVDDGKSLCTLFTSSNNNELLANLTTLVDNSYSLQEELSRKMGIHLCTPVYKEGLLSLLALKKDFDKYREGKPKNIVFVMGGNNNSETFMANREVISNSSNSYTNFKGLKEVIDSEISSVLSVAKKYQKDVRINAIKIVADSEYRNKVIEDIIANGCYNKSIIIKGGEVGDVQMSPFMSALLFNFDVSLFCKDKGYAIKGPFSLVSNFNGLRQLVYQRLNPKLNNYKDLDYKTKSLYNLDDDTYVELTKSLSVIIAHEQGSLSAQQFQYVIDNTSKQLKNKLGNKENITTMDFLIKRGMLNYLQKLSSNKKFKKNSSRYINNAIEGSVQNRNLKKDKKIQDYISVIEYLISKGVTIKEDNVERSEDYKVHHSIYENLLNEYAKTLDNNSLSSDSDSDSDNGQVSIDMFVEQSIQNIVENMIINEDKDSLGWKNNCNKLDFLNKKYSPVVKEAFSSMVQSEKYKDCNDAFAILLKTYGKKSDKEIKKSSNKFMCGLCNKKKPGASPFQGCEEGIHYCCSECHTVFSNDKLMVFDGKKNISKEKFCFFCSFKPSCKVGNNFVKFDSKKNRETINTLLNKFDGNDNSSESDSDSEGW